jgi:phage gpG-like protein
VPGNLRIRIKVDARAAIARMNSMERRSKDFRPIFRWAKRELERANAENFARNGLPVGGWSPLKPRYAAWKATKFPGAPIMVASGKLFRELRSLNGPANSIRMKSATFGTDLEYAKFHQYGTTRMPKRKIVYEPKQFAERLAILAADYVSDGRTR